MVRVRYPPSPTGDPHIGNMRSALFNYLFAKKEGGTLILRIEDTDQKRLVPGSDKRILQSLTWLGLTCDEGPIYQSKRLHLYTQAAEKLVAEGNAYYCFCTRQRLEAMREQQKTRGEPPRYDRKCFGLTQDDVEQKQAHGLPHVIRMKIPQEGTTVLDDIIRGRIEFRNQVLDDQVIIKSDGFPTYHLAVVVDDHAMDITHVIRAEEWLSSTPKHILLYQFFGWELPKFAHLPVIVGKDRSKLSKRHGAEPILTYKEQGYLPEALINFMALLGWAPPDNQEVMSLSELVSSFSLNRVQKSPASFDRKKLDWFNGYYIRNLPQEALLERLMEFVPKTWDHTQIERVFPLLRDRMVTLQDFVNLSEFFFEDITIDATMLTIPEGKNVWDILREATGRIEAAEWTHDALETSMRALADQAGLKHGDLFMVLRVAITGRTTTPPLFETMMVLGKQKVIVRLQTALSQIHT